MTIVSVGPTQNQSWGIPKQKAVFFQLCQLDATFAAGARQMEYKMG